ncbi:MAG: hypothetical protein LUE64_02415 [Candidatus Gastranaerophilales bacterium]|nr:hypothetical protein [Candidatus Gastranaerophilales bacterium]
MFEKFTQKAIDIVVNAQIQAGNFGADKVYSEFLLLGIVALSKGVQSKLIGVQNINLDALIEKIKEKKELKKGENGSFIPFSNNSKKILEKTLEIAKFYNNSLVIPSHIALAIYENKSSGAFKLLGEFDFDEEKTISTLKGVLTKKANGVKFRHPEEDDYPAQSNYFKKVDNIFTENSLSTLLSKAKAKLSTYGYEILGTEQIVQSVLDEETDVTKILAKYGITKEAYEEKLALFHSRAEEYGERQIIFTPNAFRVMLNTFEAAKETGSVSINPEHIVMGVLKSKTGIAYKILKELTGHKTNLIESLTKELNSGGKTMPETIAILTLAKAECKNLNKNIIGTEMILLGILAYGNGVASNVLEKLGITLKDARNQARKFVGNTPDTGDVSGLNYTPRAKKLLEAAYDNAKNTGKQKIMSEHLLYAFTKVKNCLGMEILENLGTDTLEIRQGILAELKNIQI